MSDWQVYLYVAVPLLAIIVSLFFAVRWIWRRLQTTGRLLAFFVVFTVVEVPLWYSVYESSTCRAAGRDPSCVSVIEAGIFWQPIAIIICFVAVLVISRIGGRS